MIIRVSSRHQVTIPSAIATAFHLRKGDVLEVEKKGNAIVMVPKEVIYEDKYSQEDLRKTEAVLRKGLPDEEISFGSGEEMMKFLRKRKKK